MNNHITREQLCETLRSHSYLETEEIDAIFAEKEFFQPYLVLVEVEINTRDVVANRYQLLTSMIGDNLAGHFLFSMNSSMVESVMIDGKWVVKNHVLVGFDVESVYEKSKKVAKKLWNKMESLA